MASYESVWSDKKMTYTINLSELQFLFRATLPCYFF